jgi:hypothetical protein
VSTSSHRLDQPANLGSASSADDQATTTWRFTRIERSLNCPEHTDFVVQPLRSHVRLSCVNTAGCVAASTAASHVLEKLEERGASYRLTSLRGEGVPVRKRIPGRAGGWLTHIGHPNTTPPTTPSRRSADGDIPALQATDAQTLLGQCGQRRAGRQLSLVDETLGTPSVSTHFSNYCCMPTVLRSHSQWCSVVFVCESSLV